MTYHYREAAIDYDNEGIVLIYVDSAIQHGNIAFAFEVPMIKGLDVNNKEDVRKMIEQLNQ